MPYNKTMAGEGALRSVPCPHCASRHEAGRGDEQKHAPRSAVLASERFGGTKVHKERAPAPRTQFNIRTSTSPRSLF